VNFGEQGFVSTQEALELVLQLRRGNVPDAVVFYDGFNDAFATYQSGSAGVHYDLGVIAAKFSCAPLWPCVGASPAVGTLLTMLGRRHEAWHSVDLERLAASTRDVYVQNYHLVAALGREYGFRYAFFVQPVLVEGRKPLTPEERAISLGEDSRLVRLIHATFDRLREVMPQYPQLHDLTDAFDSEKAYIYADSVHVAPAGNAIVARRMLNAMKRW